MTRWERIMKFSIITITYNSEKTLEETIKSVAKQDFIDYEYIIVDGGSTDHTLDIVKKYGGIVSKWISEPDKGISDAFNKGIKIATGEIICIINSDDMLCADALQTINDNIEEDTDVFYGNAIMFGRGEKQYRYKPFDNIDVLRERMAVVHPATVVRKSAYDRYGVFDIRYKCAMDRELLLRMYVAGAKFQYINHDLAKMRLGGVNQKTYLNQTVPEGIEISIKYGLNPMKAKFVGFKQKTRYRVATFVRKLPMKNQIRKIFHLRNTILD